MEEDPLPTLVCTLIWHRREPPGAEHFGFWRDGDGWQLRGTVIVPLEGVPARIRYGIICDGNWRTRAVHIALRTGSEERALHLASDGAGRWESSGVELSAVRGCIDIDLEITPSTNTLPIRRLDLAPGTQAEVTAAWVRFPSLELEPLAQTYRHLEDGRYRYESPTGYVAKIFVDDLGLAARYADLWTCVARRDAT